MTGKHPQAARARTLADDLHNDLGRCETWAAQIGVGANGLELLRLLDRVSDELERLEQRGVDLRAERGRLEAVKVGHIELQATIRLRLATALQLLANQEP